MRSLRLPRGAVRSAARAREWSPEAIADLRSCTGLGRGRFGRALGTYLGRAGADPTLVWKWEQGTVAPGEDYREALSALDGEALGAHDSPRGALPAGPEPATAATGQDDPATSV